MLPSIQALGEVGLDCFDLTITELYLSVGSLPGNGSVSLVNCKSIEAARVGADTREQDRSSV